MKTKNLNGNFNVVGLNIKKYRELNNLSQRELSDKLFFFMVSTYIILILVVLNLCNYLLGTMN